MVTSPAFSPEKSHGQRSLVDYSPWGHKELEQLQLMTEQLSACARACTRAHRQTNTHTHTRTHSVMYNQCPSNQSPFIQESIKITDNGPVISLHPCT